MNGWSQESASRAVMDACANGPHSIAMLASTMLNAGIPPSGIYLAARMAVNQLMTERRIQEVTFGNGPAVYVMPKATP